MPTASNPTGGTLLPPYSRRIHSEHSPLAGPAGRAGVYVPVHLRNRVGGPGAAPGPEETATLRVTNLSEETIETDLDVMFRPFGPIQRIFLAKDKETYRSKGTFSNLSYFTLLARSNARFCECVYSICFH